MRTVSVAEAKSQLSTLLNEAEAGHPVEITRRGKVVARLVAADPVRQPLDLADLRAHLSSMPKQDESAGDFVRRMRDEDRF